jgi:oligopeptide/dipeptide ABC transporter ATP-binding protein
MNAPKPLLSVRGLNVEFHTSTGVRHVVRDVTFSVRSGEIVALVGESGCGKSTTARSILRLLPHPMARITSGRVEFQRKDLISLSRHDMYAVRGGGIGMVFQQAMNALDPTMTIGRQIALAVRIRKDGLSASKVEERTRELLEMVQMPAPSRVVRSYPFELSGGMRQRAIIAMALAGEPRLLIADEPTTALDVTTQAQVLEVLQSLRREFGLAILLITHDLGIVASQADSVCVMYAGSIVESGPVKSIFESPLHGYTHALLKCLPRSLEAWGSTTPGVPGRLPDPREPTHGCRFEARCVFREEVCAHRTPTLDVQVTGDHRAACWVDIEHKAAANALAGEVADA